MYPANDGKLINDGPQEDSRKASDSAKEIAEQFPGRKVYLLKVVTVYEADIKVKTHLIDRRM